MKGTGTIRALTAGVAIVVGALPSYAGQSPARGPAQRPASPRTGSARIAVKDQDGTGLSEVRLLLSGAARGEFVTGGAGTMVGPDPKDGVCGLRCEHQGFMTLEREVTPRRRV